MNHKARVVLGALLLIVTGIGETQSMAASMSEPVWFLSSTTLPLEFAQNSDDQIRKELCDPEVFRWIARSCGLSSNELATTELVSVPDVTHLDIRHAGLSGETLNRLRYHIRCYSTERKEGHTQGFLLAALTNKTDILSLPDPDLRILLWVRPMLPAAFLKKAAPRDPPFIPGQPFQPITLTRIPSSTGSQTSQSPREAVFSAVDGEIEWRYMIRIKADGSVDRVWEERSDARESDPKYRHIFEEVGREVTLEMKRKGTYMHFGSCHEFWGLKKEKLKAKGIDWRSPAELNPNTVYD
jgi:hypothetical protein